MPSPIKAGVFGIARTTFTGLSNAFSMEATVIPAAIETMTQEGFTTGAICGRISPNLFGFTARNRSSLRCATISFESVVSMEKVVCSFSKVEAEWALAMIWLVFASPECKMPPIIACPIFPAPIKPIILSIILYQPFFFRVIPILVHLGKKVNENMKFIIDKPE